MSITAKELAGLLGLSPAAVSMALNNKPGVSRETRRHVLEAAQQHGYDFTRVSQKRKTTGSIYFVIFKKHGAVVADTPFFTQLSDGVNEGCRSAGYKVNIRYLYDDEVSLAREIEAIGYSDCCGAIDRDHRKGRHKHAENTDLHHPDSARFCKIRSFFSKQT